MAVATLQRLALVVHPTRSVDRALRTLREWSEHHGVEVVELESATAQRHLATLSDVGPCDLVAAVGGDGTVLTALRAAAPAQTPVLGIACGSLGALTAVSASELARALERFAEGDWTARALPALAIASDAGGSDWAINDFVLLRRGAGQLLVDVSVDGQLYARLAGDGVIAATAVGSSAYSMAAGGPLLAPGTNGFVCTPLAMHGGNAPPLVVPAEATLRFAVRPGYTGYQVDIDGQPHPL